MYYCKDCGEVFEEPVVIRDDPSPAGVDLPSGYYEYHTCPYCESDDIEEAEVCACCGEWFGGDGNLCEECLDGIEGELEKIRIRKKK